tara:strand:- start:277 stop:480 length:204 start_codon:yes stop_codon:yes gene_type:complete
MSLRCYKVYAADDVAEAMSNPHCVTTDARYNLAGDQAILKFWAHIDGCINHGEALEIVQGPDWQTEE